MIFRVRSAKAVKITDAALLKRLGVLCGFIGVALLVRTIVAPPLVVVGRTADDLKAYLCKTDWWDHTFTSSTWAFFIYTFYLCMKMWMKIFTSYMLAFSNLYIPWKHNNSKKWLLKLCIFFSPPFMFTWCWQRVIIIIVTVEVLFLAWGVRLCIMVRKAPSEFNESRFISMAIYNEFLLTCFLNVSM